MNDEIIMALRAVKEKLVEDAGFDIKRLIESIQLEEVRSAVQGRVVLQPPEGDPPNLGFRQIRFAKPRSRNLDRG
jgi:hypothetical protein